MPWSRATRAMAPRAWTCTPATGRSGRHSARRDCENLLRDLHRTATGPRGAGTATKRPGQPIRHHAAQRPGHDRRGLPRRNSRAIDQSRQRAVHRGAGHAGGPDGGGTGHSLCSGRSRGSGCDRPRPGRLWFNRRLTGPAKSVNPIGSWAKKGSAAAVPMREP